MTPGTRIDSMVELGPIIRKRRKDLGFTQTQVALLTGFSPRLIGEIERGRGTVGIDKVITYAQGLGIDLLARTRGGQ